MIKLGEPMNRKNIFFIIGSSFIYISLGGMGVPSLQYQILKNIAQSILDGKTTLPEALKKIPLSTQDANLDIVKALPYLVKANNDIYKALFLVKYDKMIIEDRIQALNNSALQPKYGAHLAVSSQLSVRLNKKLHSLQHLIDFFIEEGQTQGIFEGDYNQRRIGQNNLLEYIRRVGLNDALYNIFSWPYSDFSDLWQAAGFSFEIHLSLEEMVANLLMLGANPNYAPAGKDPLLINRLIVTLEKQKESQQDYRAPIALPPPLPVVRLLLQAKADPNVVLESGKAYEALKDKSDLIALLRSYSKKYNNRFRNITSKFNWLFKHF